uniref:Phosphoribulokinase/uridine kinase domain-containing protein n=1 Tax=Wuchereria bancrofti TaxID=6293 RepID=A0A1I8EPH1_WUCBA
MTLIKSRRLIVTISQDSFYRSLSDEEIRKANRGKFNFDHPGSLFHCRKIKFLSPCYYMVFLIFKSLDAIEFMLMISILHKMKEDESVIVPKYDFCTNSRIAKSFMKLFVVDMKLFVDANSGDRLADVSKEIPRRGDARYPK